MEPSNAPRRGPSSGNGKNTLPDWATGLLIAEAAALVIALITPVTPNKTGSQWSPAHLFCAEPTYLEEVAASFVFVNILMLLIGLAAWFTGRRRPESKEP